jgi:hypothetical protein
MVAYALNGAVKQHLVDKEERYHHFSHMASESEIRAECKSKGLLDKYEQLLREEQEYVRNNPEGYYGKRRDRTTEYSQLYLDIKSMELRGFKWHYETKQPAEMFSEKTAYTYRELIAITNRTAGPDELGKLTFNDGTYPTIKIGNEFYREEALPYIPYYIVKDGIAWSFLPEEWFDICLQLYRGTKFKDIDVLISASDGKYHRLNGRKNEVKFGLKKGLSEVVRIRQRLTLKHGGSYEVYVLTSKGMNYLTTGQKIGTEQFIERYLSEREVAELFLSDRANLRVAFPDAERYKRAVKALEQRSEQDTVQETAG